MTLPITGNFAADSREKRGGEDLDCSTERLIVVSNREPYAHDYTSDGRIRVVRPASGLVTGVEPLLRATHGTWIAYASGTADRESSDGNGKVAVPPQRPEYTLQRLWIEDGQYERYYAGFANEALWPLCHLAHTQPSFRPAEWQAYQAVNETFARAAMEAAQSDGLVLVQDYHFALAPRMLRELAPHVASSLFWHIPWPNPEAFAICPWKETLLEGMLGADILGFHTRQYCRNFLETAQRTLECRVDMEEMSVTLSGHRTLVRPYPISVEWPYPSASREDGARLRQELGIGANVHVALGVDRADYTKGLLERVAAVATLLEDNPSLRERFVYLQLASPTRTTLRRYRQLTEDLVEAVQAVNERFATDSWKPIHLHLRTFTPEEVRMHYALADSALVTPLHDGMNLVAKEYVAACEDGEGVLILSEFAGAARELDSALTVNPYDIEAVAAALLRAVRMPAAERRTRMSRMRQQIASSSIHDWSGKLVADLREVRTQATRYWPQRAAPVARSEETAFA